MWRSVRGKVVIDREEERIIVYLHFGRKHWYFFEWKASLGRMSIASQEQLEEGVQDLATLIREMKDSEKDVKDGRKRFFIQLFNNNYTEKKDFVELFREFDE